MTRLALPLPGWVAFAMGVALTVSCAKARTDVTGAPACTSWKDEIGPLFTSRCASCHTGAQPAGRYDTGSYLGWAQALLFVPCKRSTDDGETGDGVCSRVCGRRRVRWSGRGHQ